MHSPIDSDALIPTDIRVVLLRPSGAIHPCGCRSDGLMRVAQVARKGFPSLVRGSSLTGRRYFFSTRLMVLVAALPPLGMNVIKSFNLIDPVVASIDCPRDVGRSMKVTFPGELRLIRLAWTRGFLVTDLGAAVPIVGSGCTALTRPALAIVTERRHAFVVES